MMSTSTQQCFIRVLLAYFDLENQFHAGHVHLQEMPSDLWLMSYEVMRFCREIDGSSTHYASDHVAMMVVETHLKSDFLMLSAHHLYDFIIDAYARNVIDLWPVRSSILSAPITQRRAPPYSHFFDRHWHATLRQ